VARIGSSSSADSRGFNRGCSASTAAFPPLAGDGEERDEGDPRAAQALSTSSASGPPWVDAVPVLDGGDRGDFQRLERW